MPDDIFSNPPRGCKTIDLRSGRVIADGGTMPTKPEGPAQEPATVEQVRDAIAHGGDHRDIINRPTPAPSQPAGAREWLLAREYEMFLSSHVGMSGKLLCDTLELYARQQTAAKDAELKLVSAELYKTKIAHSEANARWMAAERERDSLREALEGVMPQVQPCASAYCEEHGHTDCPFGVAVAALKAGKDGQQ